MKGLSLTSALLASLLAFSTAALAQETDSQMSETSDTQQMNQGGDHQQNKNDTAMDKETAGHDGMKGMESKAEQKRRELEEKSGNDMLPNTGTDAGYEAETDTDGPTN
ncbi:hypothetical protein [Halomonas sp. PR-M31]|uniref:hypothetical protein n=1 Tax=Halomonas sp. PR-M31 TaxID=1471202 RepID=UPI000650FFF9|nr:hypothetical protein [Halomonas sp. PR-M31]